MILCSRKSRGWFVGSNNLYQTGVVCMIGPKRNCLFGNMD